MSALVAALTVVGLLCFLGSGAAVTYRRAKVFAITGTVVLLVVVALVVVTR